MRIGDFCSINLLSYSENEKWNEIHYLDTGNITKGKIAEVQILIPGSDTIPSRARRKVQVNDIIYSTVRPNQRHYGIIKEYDSQMLVSTGFVVITVDQKLADPDFIYYFLTQDDIVETLQAIGEQSTSAYPSIKPGDIENLEIKLPSLELQRSVGSFLRQLDEKCAANDAINDNLQQQALALYSSMFLENAEQQTTPGTLKDIADITMGQSPSGTSYNESGNGEVFYQGRAEFGSRFPTRRLYTTEPKRTAEAGDVLLSVRAPVGDLNVAYERCCIGRGLGAIRSKTGHRSFVLYTMFALRPQLDVFNSEGTVFGSINHNALNDMPISVPSSEAIASFEAAVRPMDDLIRSNYEENYRLQELRDSLLPRLMSGEVDVSDIHL